MIDTMITCLSVGGVRAILCSREVLTTKSKPRTFNHIHKRKIQSSWPYYNYLDET
jgi:hypothetical protein